MFKILHGCPSSHIRSRPTKKVAQRWFEQPDGVSAGKSIPMQASLHTSKKVHHHQCSAGCAAKSSARSCIKYLDHYPKEGKALCFSFSCDFDGATDMLVKHCLQKQSLHQKKSAHPKEQPQEQSPGQPDKMHLPKAMLRLKKVKKMSCMLTQLQLLGKKQPCSGQYDNPAKIKQSPQPLWGRNSKA